MSEQEFESYLRLLCRFLRLSGGQRETIARELRGHMEERLEELIDRGYTREDAIQTALDEFGDAAALAGEFGRIGRRRRWIMRTTGGIAGVAAAVLMVSFLMPENRRFVPAPLYSLAGGAADGPEVSAGTDVAAASPARPIVRGSLYRESEAEAKTQARLSEVLPEVNFAQGSTFEDVIEFFRQSTGVSIMVNWNALAASGIDRTSELSLSMKQVKLRTALSLALENAGAASGVKLGYDLWDGIVRVSTVGDLNARTVMRVYDCRDLIHPGLTPAQQQAIDSLRTRFGPSTRPAGPSSSTEGGAELTQALEMLRQVDVERFSELIRSTVEPGSWEGLGAGAVPWSGGMPGRFEGPMGMGGGFGGGVGGPASAGGGETASAAAGGRGSISIYDGLLVVRHTYATQEKVVELLEMLRAARAARGERSELPVEGLSQR